MTNIITEYPVKTLDGIELLPEGTELTEETLEELAKENASASYESLPLMDYGTVRQDLLIFINYPPYNIVFSDLEQNQDILKILESVKHPLPILESLEYFKQNDFQTYRHSLMVLIVSVLLAKKLLPDYKELFSNTIIGSSHDIGKICLPLEILKKSTPLTKSEHKQLTHHTVAGYLLLSYFLKDHKSFIAKLARDHHERRDKSGYPRGIEQTDTIVEIVTVADIYDALLMPRSYRPISYDNRTALEEMTKIAERGAIGWDVLKALIAQNRIEKPSYHDIIISEKKRGKAPKRNLYGKIIDD
jgi:HD-GYP domain-containing protein (c-di-GMP phosphodiesterase class II)